MSGRKEKLATVIKTKPTPPIPSGVKIEKYRPKQWRDRSPESLVGNVELYTEESKKWRKPTILPPFLIIPDLFAWQHLRPSNHERFTRADTIFRLRTLSVKLKYGSYRNEIQRLARIKRDLEEISPCPELPSGWAAIGRLAAEVIVNAVCLWGGEVYLDSFWNMKGVARRLTPPLVKPSNWNGLRIQQRPMWVVEMENGVSFVAPDWFWATRDLIPGWGERGCKEAAAKVVTEYLTRVLVELSANENALKGAPQIIIKTLDGVSPRFGLEEAVGQFVQRTTKLAIAAYTKLPEEIRKGVSYLTPGFVESNHELGSNMPLAFRSPNRQSSLEGLSRIQEFF